MKELIAVIRPSRAKLTKQKLAEQGFPAFTEERVLGRGKQKGLQYAQGNSGRDGAHGISFLPKRMLTLFVEERQTEEVLAILLDANKTGEVGDGKIFICSVEEIVRIRTDERRSAALI